MGSLRSNVLEARAKKRSDPARAARLEQLRLSRAKAEAARVSPKMRRRSLLHELDSQTRTLSTTLKYLLKTRATPSTEPQLQAFLVEAKSSLLGILKIFEHDSKSWGFGAVQQRSLHIFSRKIASAATPESFLDALDYFGAKSCILKLSER